MTTYNPKTPGNDVGLPISKSRRVVIGQPFGTVANWVKAGSAGTIVWQNLSQHDEPNIIETQAGEMLPIECDIILSGATIDGTPETTTVINLIWACAKA